MKRKLTENLRQVQDRIAQACSRAGRMPEDVTIVAVTKYATLEAIHALVEIGVRDLGESKVQALSQRSAMVGEWVRRKAIVEKDRNIAPPRWHMVGHLQRNKVKAVLPHAHLIHSIDSLKLAEEVDRQAGRDGRRIRILVQVNATNEPQKSGLLVPAVTHFVEQLATLRNTSICGLMTMGKAEDMPATRRAFQLTRELFSEIVGERLAGEEFRCLSMGMSEDYEIGVECGATHVRIGSALFEQVEGALADPGDDEDPAEQALDSGESGGAPAAPE